MRHVPPLRAWHRVSRRLALCLVLSACSGEIGGVEGDPPGGPGSPAPAGGASPVGGGASPAAPGSAAPPAAAPAADPAGPAGPGGPAVVRPEGDVSGASGRFDCKAGDLPASAPRLWRLTGPQYQASVRALSPALGKESLPNPFDGTESTERFTNDAGTLGIPGPTFERALSASEPIAARLLLALRGELPCTAAPDAACVRRTFETVGARAFRRPLTAEERDRYVAFVASLQPGLQPPEALRMGLQALLQAPSFLFRTELGEARPDSTGRRRLTPYEVAAALSYTLTDAPPDTALMRAAADGALGTAAELRPHVARLLGGAAQNAAVRRFFREYLRYERALDVFKDPKEFPFHSASALLADTDRFVVEVLEGKDVLRTLLTADWGFAGPKTAPSYNLEPATAPKAQARVTFPAEQRAGILTQPSFLVGFSENDHTDPIRRGLFIAQSLLCLDIPSAPPENVPPLPDTPNATMREKLSVHTNAAPGCRACHDILDNLGLALEVFDHVGRFRTTEQGKPADGRGAIVGTGTSIDGPFGSPFELARRMAGSPQVEQCFLRHAFRYWLGRAETAGDACALAEAQEAWRRSGGDYAQMLTTLLTSDSFLYRN